MHKMYAKLNSKPCSESIKYALTSTCFTSYHIILYCTFLRRQFKNTSAAAIKQTSKFSAVLQMFQETVSGHECQLASCSRCVGGRRQMICHTVQFLSAERRASKYQLIACQNDGPTGAGLATVLS